MIGVIDLGLGNSSSVVRMIDKAGGKSFIITSPFDVKAVDKIVLPGVGNFSHGVNSLDRLGFRDSLINFARQGLPILGICLGMQLLCVRSEEGSGNGLGLVDAEVLRFTDPTNSYKVPHMGWNVLFNPHGSLFNSDFDEYRFYFVHSYFVKPSSTHVISSTCSYISEFCASFQYDNIFGVQFHPEKSHKFGLALFSNFVNL